MNDDSIFGLILICVWFIFLVGLFILGLISSESQRLACDVKCKNETGEVGVHAWGVCVCPVLNTSAYLNSSRAQGINKSYEVNV